MRIIFLFLSLLFALRGFPQSFTVSDHYREVSASYFINKVGNEIWVGTNGGAVYFDQKKEEKGYYTKMNSGIRNNDIAAVAIDFNGDLWIGTFGEGVARFRQGNWEVFDNITSIFSSSYVNCLALDSMGVVWAGTTNGLMSYDGSAWTNYNHISSPAPKNDYINAITVAPDGNVWIGTGSSGVFEFSHTTGWNKYVADDHTSLAYPINDIEIDQELAVWVATYGKGLLRWKNDKWTSFEGLPSDYLWAIAPHPTGGIWVGSNGGGLFFFKNDQWNYYDSSNSGLSGNLIDALYCDAEGRVWCGNVFAGVDIYDGVSWEQLHFTSLYDNNIKKLWYDKQAKMYVRNESAVTFSVSNGKIDSIFDEGKSFYPFAYNTALSDGSFWSVSGGLYKTQLAEHTVSGWSIQQTINIVDQEPATEIAIDKNDVKWIGKYGHLYKVQNNQLIPVNYTNDPLPGEINRMRVDANNVLWLATYGAGIYYFDGQNWGNYNSANSDCPSNIALSLAVDQQNNKWIGTTAGVFVVGPTGNQMVFNASNSPMKDPVIFDLDVAVDGSVWIAAWQQLLQYKDGIFYSFNTADLIPDFGCPSGVSDFIRALRVDKTNKVWVGTNCNGIVVIEPQLAVPGKEISSAYRNLEVFPNPTTGNFSLKTEINRGDLFVFNASGQLIHFEKDPPGQVHLSGRANGMYYLKFVTNEGVFHCAIMLTGN